MGLAYYVGDVLDDLLDRPYALLHTETYDADVEAAARWLGCAYVQRPRKHADYATRSLALSDAARATLLAAPEIQREYEILARLEAGPGRVALTRASPSPRGDI